MTTNERDGERKTLAEEQAERLAKQTPGVPAADRDVNGNPVSDSQGEAPTR